MITLQEVAVVLGLALTAMSILNFVLLFKDRAGKPHKKNEARILKLENEVAKIKQDLQKDDARIIELDKDTKIIMKSINALLGHGIDGNNDAEMREARKELNEYLITK